MVNLDVSRIESWHAHVYFDAVTRDAALAFRNVVSTQFADRVSLPSIEPDHIMLQQRFRRFIERMHVAPRRLNLLSAKMRRAQVC